jgi:ribosomal protein S18 acetylase RimI-like enzyme
MLRPATSADTPAILALGVATGMFRADEVDGLRDILDDVHAGRLGPDQHLVVWDDARSKTPAGVVYFRPNVMSDRTWDLLMIAVAPERQGRGIGGMLITFAEATIREAGGRMLLIDTSSLPKYDGSRVFYRKHGFEEVATIPDFYTDGDSKVIFARRLIPDFGSTDAAPVR